MSEAFDVLYKSLETSVHKLMEEIRFLNEKKIELIAQTAFQQESITKMQQQLKEWEEKYKLLKAAGVLGMIDKKDVGQMQHKINSLVREIDSCKALIIEE